MLRNVLVGLSITNNLLYLMASREADRKGRSSKEWNNSLMHWGEINVGKIFSNILFENWEDK